MSAAPAPSPRFAGAPPHSAAINAEEQGPPSLADVDRDERIETFLTPRDWLRYAVSRFLAAGLAFGHGVTSALDEAAFLILEGLQLPSTRSIRFSTPGSCAMNGRGSATSSKRGRRSASRPLIS